MNEMDSITGKTLIAWGYEPGPWFPAAIAAARTVLANGGDEAAARRVVAELAPPPPLPLRPVGASPVHMNIAAENAREMENIANVEKHMRELSRLPTVKMAAVMPDACPAGTAPGTIPVGAVVAAENAIHPGMHSSDICCSMAVTIFGDIDATNLLEAGMKLSHFGGGGRPRGQQIEPSEQILSAFESNEFLRPHVDAAIEHFATQGDGNHFFYVGRLKSSSQIALVTHRGSRKPGAMLYKAGMTVAEKYRQRISPETPKHNAWIPADTKAGETYWSALQTIRAWTKANHFAIHDRIATAIGVKPADRFWNEHNFVFRKSDGLFYHAKGATPAWQGFADDDSGLTLIPLNMAAPILIAKGLNRDSGLGFAPHGAGRNFSRTAYLREVAERNEAELIAEQTKGIDVRFFCGVPDISELPLAYKREAAVRKQIADYGLAEIVDEIVPIGCIMAGDWQRDAPWRRKGQTL
jgi:RNA-splicing ligase RtcB